MVISDFGLDDMIDSKALEFYFLRDKENTERLLQIIIKFTFIEAKKELDKCLSRLDFSPEKAN
ncbi:MAG: hypothetical protein ABI045_07375 [Flavobacteriales bacterium]